MTLAAYLSFLLGGPAGATVTLARMREAIRLEGSWENSSDITDALLNNFINRGVREVWDLLKSKRDDLLVASINITTSPGFEKSPLPDGFYQLRKLEIADPSSRSGWRRIRKVDLDVSHHIANLQGKNYRYRLQGNTLVLHPTPQAAEQLRMFYIPVAPRMADDADTFDGINGYEELVFQIVVMRCRDRQEQDVSVQVREIQRLTANISAASDGRDVEPFYLNPYGATGGACDDDDEAYWTS